MKSRILLTAGVGLAALSLNSCGQKPAPAAEAVSPVASDAQAMRVTRVAMRDMSDGVNASGRLVVREEAAVGSELPGYRVRSVYVDEGDFVKAGQAMAQLDDPLLQAQIAQAVAQLATQKATADFKKSQLQRAESLAKEGAFSAEMLEQRRMEALSAEASLLAAQAGVDEMKVRQSRMTLRAPVAGVVLQRAIRPGEISMAGGATPYFRIAREGLIELDAELPDAQLAHIAIGDTATVYLSSGGSVQGKVRFISPRVDAGTSLGRVRIELPYDPSLRPGGFAEAAFEGKSRQVLSAPAASIRYESGGPVLMVVGDDNRVRRAPVKIGERVGDYVQLVDGPPEGSRVLATGSSFTLDGDLIEPLEAEVSANVGSAATGAQ